MQSLYRRFISMAFLAYTAAGHLRARLGQSLLRRRGTNVGVSMRRLARLLRFAVRRVQAGRGEPRDRCR